MSKVVAITGANGGIGRALVKEFQSYGYHVVGLDLAPESVDTIEYYSLDVTNTQSALSTYEQIAKKHPTLSIWVNNAGIAVLKPFLETAAEEFNKVIDVNFSAVVTGTKFWLSRFTDGGTVVNIASAAGFIPSGDMASYVASKHAVVGFTRAVQMELEFSDSKAATCLIAPGFVQTDIMKVGSKYGLPKELEKFASTPAACAKEIVSGVLAGEREIIPTISGKLMTGMYRFLPFGHRLALKVYRKSREIKEK